MKQIYRLTFMLILSHSCDLGRSVFLIFNFLKNNYLALNTIQ